MTTIYSAFTWIALSTYQKIDLIVDFVDITFNAIFIVIIIATNVQWENRVRPMRKKNIHLDFYICILYNICQSVSQTKMFTKFTTYFRYLLCSAYLIVGSNKWFCWLGK